MKKNYVKMNIDDNELSIGNLCRLVKGLSKNKSSAMQGEIFACLFNTDLINETTINNYCVGIRSINDQYKQIYLNYKRKYEKDKLVLEPIIKNLISIMDGILFNEKNINNSFSLKLLCNKLYNISKNDKTCTEEFTSNIYKQISNDNLIEALSEILFFIILEKKQPVYENDLKVEIIENILNDTNISAKDLEEYLNIKLSEQINFNMKLKNLSENGNAYACFELGMEEYKGNYAGFPRYMEALKYFKKASLSNHAESYYMIARLYYNMNVGNKEKEEMKYAFDCLEKAIKLGSITAINLKGLFYLNGIYPVRKNTTEAIKYFEEAGSKEYSYSYNTLGLIYEKEKSEKAIDYYKKSAELGNAWALNRLGEYYRKRNKYEDAFKCYQKSIDVPIENLCPYAYFNLAKYYYINGNSYITLEEDETKAIEYLKIASKKNIMEADEELLYYHANKYLNKEEKDLKEFNYYKEKIELYEKFNKEIKKEIENKLVEIKNKLEINSNIIK